MEKSVALLQRVLEKKEAVPAVRFRQDIPHRPGRISSGRYPQKATKTILSLLNAAQANAENKGLDAQNLVVKTIIANKASRPYRTGRIRGIRARRTHIQIIVEEKEIKESVQTKRVAHKKQQEQIQPKEKKA